MIYHDYDDRRDFGILFGMTLAEVRNINDEELVLVTADGRAFKLYHEQDCCERVHIEDIAGNLDDLIGSPITMAEESTSDENPEGAAVPEYQDSFTWTFYKLATIKGYVDIRWYGESNGYYSERVTFVECLPSGESLPSPA